jgi:hypothetical protein
MAEFQLMVRLFFQAQTVDLVVEQQLKVVDLVVLEYQDKVTQVDLEKMAHLLL